jgi:hypothetical protein
MFQHWMLIEKNSNQFSTHRFFFKSLALSDLFPFLLFFVSIFSLCSALFAKHVNDKAAKWAKSKRPRKSRPSDINRKPIIYAIHSFKKPAEYDISDEAAVLMVKPAATGN